VRRFEHKPWLDGFSLFGYLTLLASITNAIDPMRHAEDGGEPEYLMDFDTYGLCFLEIAPVSRREEAEGAGSERSVRGRAEAAGGGRDGS